VVSNLQGAVQSVAMRRLSSAILAVVALFVVVVAVTLIVKSRSIRPDLEEMPVSRADFRIREVRLEEEGGPVRWRLVADQAEVFEAEERTALRRPIVDIQEATRAWRVQGDEGDVKRQGKDLEVRKNVIVVSDDGLRLETSVLRWDAATGRLWTDAAVTLTRGGAVVRGSGLSVYVSEDRAVVTGPVRVSISGMSALRR
jgi:LPS export ABC transporter protein LptC